MLDDRAEHDLCVEARTMIRVDPAIIAALKTHEPYTCGNGRELITRSPGPRADITAVPTAAPITARCGCIAPFGWPVVPDV